MLKISLISIFLLCSCTALKEDIDMLDQAIPKNVPEFDVNYDIHIHNPPGVSEKIAIPETKTMETTNA